MFTLIVLRYVSIVHCVHPLSVFMVNSLSIPFLHIYIFENAYSLGIGYKHNFSPLKGENCLDNMQSYRQRTRNKPLVAIEWI